MAVCGKVLTFFFVEKIETDDYRVYITTNKSKKTQKSKMNNNMALGMMMRPMEPGENAAIFTDDYGYTWKQETSTGFRRTIDRFFIPHMSLYNHKNHSVESQVIINQRNKQRTPELVSFEW